MSFRKPLTTLDAAGPLTHISGWLRVSEAEERLRLPHLLRRCAPGWEPGSRHPRWAGLADPAVSEPPLPLQ